MVSSPCGCRDCGLADFQSIPVLIPFTERLDVSLPVRIEEFLAAFLRSGVVMSQSGPYFLVTERRSCRNFESGPSEEPATVIDLVNEKTGFEDNHVGDHGIVNRIGVFGDVEIFLDDTRGKASGYRLRYDIRSFE